MGVEKCTKVLDIHKLELHMKAANQQDAMANKRRRVYCIATKYGRVINSMKTLDVI